jgi:dimethylargininase
MSRIAITRGVSENVHRCELTHLAREKIDHQRAVAQHREYQNCLVELGCELVTLPGDPELPDCVFVEDIAVVLDEVAVITRPGAESRRPETPAIREALEPFRQLLYIREPGLLDGGDVLVVGQRVFVGRSTRTNAPGIAQLIQLLVSFPYEVRDLDFHSCLHLKSAVTAIGERTLLIQKEWVSPDEFEGLELIAVDPAEPHGGNALWVGDTVVYPTGYDRTRARIEERGFRVRTVEQSELAKAEGGVTCGSLIFEGDSAMVRAGAT